jgi:hypothetical protein
MTEGESDMAHILGSTETQGPITNWIQVIAKAAALGQISDNDPDPKEPTT